MSKALTPDVLVLGLGAMGSATALHLARCGARVIGVDQFSPPHAFGSTHGETRITRVATGEGADYVPLAQRSHFLWRQIERETGAQLLTQCGGLLIAREPGLSPMHEQRDFLGATITNAKRFNVPHEILTAGEVAKRYPQFALTGEERAYFEPGAGYLDPEACVAAQLQLARECGAELRTNASVRSIHMEGQQAVATLDDTTIKPGRLVVCAGAWLPPLLAMLKCPAAITNTLVIRRQVLHWFAPERTLAPASNYEAAHFPIFIWHWGGTQADVFYGFPASANGVKVATEQMHDATTAAAVMREVEQHESEAMYAMHVRGRLRGVTAHCVQAKTCLYTNAPHAKFLIGSPPGFGNVIAVSACSGHGFKHSAAIGEAVAAYATTNVLPAVLAPFAWG